MGYLLEDLRVFGVNADHWMTEAQDERALLKTSEQGAERFISKWIASEKARTGLRRIYAIACPNVTGRTKEKTAQSNLVRAGSLAIVDKLKVARICIPRAFLFKEKSERA